MKPATWLLWALPIMMTAAAGCSSTRAGLAHVLPMGPFEERPRFIKTELYFGLSKPDGLVTEEEFQSFVDDFVTPRFEEGLTILNADGQYMGEVRDLVKEKSKVVILIHEDTPQASKTIEFIRAAYRRRFQQESVLRTTERVEVSFAETAEILKTRELGTLSDERINESSGLAYSTLSEGVLWTHNDSGDGPLLYALNLEGRSLATYTVDGVKAYDWEDMASVRIGSRSYLVVGDVGDNGRIRAECMIYLIEEPLVMPDQLHAAGTVGVSRAVAFTYDDGPHDCEAIGVDPETQTVYLLSKNRGRAPIYALKLPPVNTKEVQTARYTGLLRTPRATGLDFSRDGLRMVVLTYGDAYEYRRQRGEAWSSAFKRQPRVIQLPERRQGEAICYSPDSTAFYLTSERLPAPLWEVPIPVK
ncbi:MAG: DUF3574 domain-containing protein [Kiritimatiellae bacterium]|nr:DUF3574 domain-containing protein [Kiritimatiellia bacterium]